MSRVLTAELRAPSSLWFGICLMSVMVSVAVTAYAFAAVRPIVYALTVPSNWPTYRRPSGPNCRVVGMLELDPPRVLLPNPIGIDDTPVPDRPTDAVLEPVCEKVSVAAFAPRLPGVKVTGTVVDAPGASVTGAGWLSPNDEAFVPVIEAPDTVIEGSPLAPRLVSVTAWLVVVPTTRDPKSRGAGLTSSWFAAASGTISMALIVGFWTTWAKSMLSVLSAATVNDFITALFAPTSAKTS